MPSQCSQKRSPALHLAPTFSPVPLRWNFSCPTRDERPGVGGAKRRRPRPFTCPIHPNAPATVLVKTGGTVSRLAISRSKTENLHTGRRACYSGRMPSQNDSHELLTLPEVAARLRVNRRTLERLIAAKEFPLPLKVGSRSLVPLADLRAYLANLFQLRDRRAST